MRKDTKNIIKNLIKYLKFRRQVDLLPEIIKGLEQEAEYLNPENTAIVTTAYKLGLTEKKLLKTQLEAVLARKLNLKIQTDPNIIGGMMIKIADKIIDLSMLGYLNNLDKKLKKQS